MSQLNLMRFLSENASLRPSNWAPVLEGLERAGTEGVRRAARAGRERGEYGPLQVASEIRMSLTPVSAGTLISRYPVTNVQFEAFAHDTGYPLPAHLRSEIRPYFHGDQFPVVNVSWIDANAFCAWLSDITGRALRLPTESEWTLAAGWENGVRDAFPFGESFASGACNTWEAGLGHPSPIGMFSPGGDSRLGIADMAGNVWEWVSDAGYDENELPPGLPSALVPRVQKGGTFLAGSEFAAIEFRLVNLPGLALQDFGFRVACSNESP
jgi:formylglycine-generating enzyme required for sulfatase activity